MRTCMLIAAAALLPGPAHPAPGVDAAAGPSTDTIIVTATRTPQAADRTGSAVTVVTRTELDDRQAMTAEAALAGVPGLSIARAGPAGAQTQVRMRGAEANQVLVMVDGVEASDLAGADEFAFEHLTTFDIERIEVVRGPQSALWGSDAMAGLINVVTRRPRSSLETEAFVEGGSFGSVDGGVYAGGRSARGYASLAASTLSTDGTNASLEGSEDDAYDNTTLSIAGGFDLPAGLRLEASGRRITASKDYDGESTTTGLPADDANGDQVVDTFTTDITHNYLRIGATWQPPDSRWWHQLRYAVTDTDNDTRAEDIYGGGGIQHSSQSGRRYGAYYQGSLQLGARTDEHPADVITIALDHERQQYSQSGPVLDYGPGYVYDPNQDQSMQQSGIVVEYLAYAGPGLSLSASGRHDDYSDFADASTWRLTASWVVPATAARLHGSVGTGVKTPTFTERFGFYPQQFVGNPDLEPEKSTGWDAGLEYRLAGGRVVADATYFRADLRDEINGLYCPPTQPLCTAANDTGTSHRQGVEIALDAALGAGLTLSAAYTYTDASEPAPQGGQEHEVRRPWNTGTAYLNGRWLSARLNVNLGAHYVGQREDVYFDPATFAPDRVSLSAYTLVELGASYALTPTVTVYGRVENALDEDYEDVYGFNSPGVAGFAGVRVSMAR